MSNAAKRQNPGKEGKSKDYNYSKFDELDGSHPLQENAPESCILYPTRILSDARVTYFNFPLAKEMGLIPKSHPHKVSPALEKKLIETFSLRIINEYDQEKNIKFRPSKIKPKEYMATRYLQLQHPNKQGKTSGDGRGIWNGTIENRGRVWDVSSRGTGVTALAPGAVEAGKPLKSGSTSFGYGCGLAEIDELYSSEMLSEIFYNNGINTERMLAIIDIGKNLGIGVRAAPNLLRPAHLFMYLKQGEYDPLKRIVDYLIERQEQNGEWKVPQSGSSRYERALQCFTKDFAHFAALLEREYIFTWLDWDGDNVLANAGIIDYGSIRQFGLRHDQYRFDDVDRFSTNLNEQRRKAKLTVQVFAQAIDFIVTKEKKPLQDFAEHPVLQSFEDHFSEYILDRYLFQLGFTETQIKRLLKEHHGLVEQCYQSFEKLEKRKTHKKLAPVDDGVNKPAIYNMRKLVVQMPDIVSRSSASTEASEVPYKEMFELMLSTETKGKDRRLTQSTKQHLTQFYTNYCELVQAINSAAPRRTLNCMKQRAPYTSNETPVTGNALIYITETLMSQIKRGLTPSHIQAVMDEFVEENSYPEFVRASKTYQSPKKPAPRALKIVSEMLDIVEDHKESI